MNRVNIVIGRLAHIFFDNSMTDKIANLDDARALKQIARVNLGTTIWIQFTQSVSSKPSLMPNTNSAPSLKRPVHIDAIIDDDNADAGS
jgi:hypothetical protein